MRFSTFKTVFRKEFANIGKNPTSFFLAILFPFIFVIFYISVISNMANTESKKNEAINIALYIRDNEKLNNVYDNDETNYHENYTFIKENFLNEDNYNFIKTDDAYKDSISGKIDLILTFDKTINNSISENTSVDIYYNPSDDNALGKLAIVIEKINLYSATVSEFRLNAIGSSLQDITPVILTSTNYNEFFKEQKIEGFGDTILSSALPSCFICFIAFGGIAFGAEMFVMEKEKGTLEVLLATNANRTQILLGKVAVHILFSLFTLFAEILGFTIGYFINYSFLSSIDIYFRMTTLLSMFFTIASVSILCSTLSATVFVFSKNSKTANIGQSVVSLIPSFLSIFLVVLKKSALNNALFRFIPLLNSLFAFKLSALGFVNIPLLILSGLFNLILSAFLIYFSVKRFNSEKILAIN